LTLPGTTTRRITSKFFRDSSSVHVVAPASSGFDWGTAAIGAAISLLLMAALLGIAATVRRRHTVITG